MQLDLIEPESVARVEYTEEYWRHIDEFPGYYVSTMGRFRRGESPLTGSIKHNGYVHIGLMKDGKQVWRLAHRVVAQVFLDQPSKLHGDVNHRNRSRSDNRLANLEWMTRSQNAKHWRDASSNENSHN
jgi:hypothetical protein